MGGSRTLPLFDPAAQPSSCWNERMSAVEYAVHYSSFANLSIAPFCTVFRSLPEAESYAKEQIALRPDLRCRIYDHHGLVGEPIREFRGATYKGDGDLSPRFRRWLGSILFFGGLILTLIDWRANFRFVWPALIGTRIILPGLLLLLTEAIILFYAKRRAAYAGEKTP